MQYIDNILFLILIVIGFGLFFKSLKELTRNVNLGKDIDRSDNKMSVGPLWVGWLLVRAKW